MGWTNATSSIDPSQQMITQGTASAPAPPTDQQKADAVANNTLDTILGGGAWGTSGQQLATANDAIRQQAGYETLADVQKQQADYINSLLTNYTPQAQQIADASGSMIQSLGTGASVTGALGNENARNAAIDTATAGTSAANYALGQGSAITGLGDSAATMLGGQGANFLSQGAGTQSRTVGTPSYGGMNTSLSGATNLNNTAQNSALNSAAADFTDANQSIARSAPNYAQADRGLGSANLNYTDANQYLQGARQDYTLANQYGLGAKQDYTQANQYLQGAGPSFGASNGSLANSQALASQLANLENTKGPSAAQAQLQSGLNQSQQSALALARSGRGFGGNAAALNQAAVLNANASQQAVNQSAMLRAQEDAAQRQRMAANLGAAAGINQGASAQQIQQQQLSSNVGLAQAQQAAAQQQAQSQLGMQQAAMLAGQQQAQSQLGMQQAAMLQSQQQAQADLQMQKSAQLSNEATQGSQAALAAAGLQQQQQQISSQADLARAAQYGQQQQFLAGQNLAVAQQQLAQQQLATGNQLSNAQLNDQTMLGLYGLGQNSLLQGANLQLQAAQNGANLGLQGMGMNIGAQQASGQLSLGGTQAQLAGLQQSVQDQQAAAGLGMQAIGVGQNYNQDILQQYAIQMGQQQAAAALAAQQDQFAQQQTAQYVGMGMSGLGLALAASDRNMKKDIEPTNGQLLIPAGVGASGDNQAQGSASSDASDAASGRAKGMRDAQKRAALGDKIGGGFSTLGSQLMHGGGAPPVPTPRPYMPQFTDQPQYGYGYQPYVMSDEDEKEAVRTVANTPGYSFRYKDPEAAGATDGMNYGIMAQDLEKTPAGRSVVKQGPEGHKMVDTSRLTMVNTAALNGLQKQVDELHALIAKHRSAA